jgi:glycosyltransferase involved in cell wall biosynthesis
MVYFYLIFVVILLSIFLLIFLVKDKINKNERYYNLDEISVVIPFRNEAKNLPKILKSIENLILKPKEFIFIDDHSEDDSLQILQKSEISKIIISLEKTDFGKKAAIHKGVLSSKGRFILFWDADIIVKADFFSVLSELKISNLLILPVKMRANSVLGYFASLDYYFLNSISFVCGKLNQHLVASAANLLVEKQLYTAYEEQNNSMHISSGDDMFLLNFGKNNKYQITNKLDESLCVTCEAPANLKDFIHQRLRWIGKTKQVGDKFAFAIALLGLVYHLFVWLILFQNFDSFLLLIFLKVVVDFTLFFPYVIKINDKTVLLFSTLYTFFYPIYFIMLTLSFFIIKPKWKGRRIITNSF